ncbi:MAG: polyphosphate kinase 1 [Actinomycetota bacterium]
MEAAATPSSLNALARPGRFINRELSWLDFNARVLALAEDESVPLLERVKFLSIFARNLDEFFQVRVSGLREQVQAGVQSPSVDGLLPAEQLLRIRAACLALVDRSGAAYADLRLALEKERVRIIGAQDLTDEDRAFLSEEFADRIFPVLTPLSVDPAHPFPYISNLSLNLATTVRDPVTGVRRFARVKIPPLLPRFVPLPDRERFIPLEDVVAEHVDALFLGMQVLSHHVFRVTRDADVDVEEDEAEDLLAAVQSVIRWRRRSASPVRLEVDETMPADVVELLARELELTADDVYRCKGLLDLGGLSAFNRLDRPDLKYETWTTVTPPELAATEDIFEALRRGDVLIHHPYDSFVTTTEAFVEQAADDPAVLAIKQPLYRTSTQESPIIRALMRAAETGKQVVALVELKARFDEEANIGYAQSLEEAGVHVAYGVVGLKTHAKISLVVRREGRGIRRYAHVGTGNYNAVTAATYEDLGLLTADPDLGADLSELFNALSGYSRQRQFRRVVVAPHSLRSRMLDMIRGQAHEGGRVVMKMNSLVDADMIDALYEASQARCRIDLIVRGVCCLVPGVPGLSERINVRSIVGRYLEHSRIFRFGADDEQREYYIGSADLMPRNLDRRVEALVPVTDPTLVARLDEIIDVELADDVLAWELGSDGAWRHVECVNGIDAQVRLHELALMRGTATAR